jgi:hypothetical protein
MRSPTTQALVMVGVLVVLSGCGYSVRPLSADQVRSAFRGHDLALRVVVNSRTLDAQRIDQLARVSTSDVGARRAAKLAVRASLGQMRARAARHPVIWLTTSARLDTAGANTVDVLVWGRISDAEAQMAKAKRALRSSRTPGLVLVRNAFIAYPADADPVTVARVNAAVKALRNG